MKHQLNKTDFFRICPTCNNINYYSTKYTLQNAIEKNPNSCNYCKNIGNKKCAWNKGLTKKTNESLLKMSKKVSKTMKQKNIIPWNKGLTKETDERVLKMSKKRKGFNHTNEAKIKISESSKKHWKNPEYRKKVIEKSKIGLKKAYEEGRRTQINHSKAEDKFEEILIRLKEEYQKNFYIKTPAGTKIYDFYLPKRHIVIEIDGTFWHSKDYWNGNQTYDSLTDVQKMNIKNDIYKNQWIRIKKHELIRIWEDEITFDNVKIILNNAPKRVKLNLKGINYAS